MSEEITVELSDSNDSFMLSEDHYRRILIKGPGDFGIIFSTSMELKDGRPQNHFMGNINIFLPSEIFDKVIDTLGEEYRKNVKKDVVDIDTLKIDYRITLSRNESRLVKFCPKTIEELMEKVKILSDAKDFRDL